MFDFWTRHISSLFMSAWTSGWLPDSTIDRVIRTGMAWSTQMRWEVGLTQAFWGIERPSMILREMKRYSLRGGYLRQVKCPVLVTGAGKSLYFDKEEHTMRVFSDLNDLGERDRQLWLPSQPEEGGL